DGMATRLAAFRQGLKEVGLVEGENVTIVYRWAEGRVDRLPEMASELARQATVIVTSGGPCGSRRQSGHHANPLDYPGRRKPAPAAISRGSICWPTNWRPSGCSSCTSSFPKLSASPSS